MSAPLTERAIDAYQEKANAAIADRYEMLTAREREVLQLAAEGRTSPEIARRLNISPRTVETHRTNLMRKLGLRTQTDLVKYAIERRLIALSNS